jgi:hypothetical protein
VTDASGPAAPKDLLADQPRWPDHPVICTFATRLPFPLRLEDNSWHAIVLTSEYVDKELADSLFPGPAYVRIRVCNQPLTSHSIYAITTGDALGRLYGYEGEIPSWSPEGAYDQWISLETPSLRLTGDGDEDHAYHFHRCLGILDLWLRSHNIMFREPQVYPVSAHDLDPVVFVGQYEHDGTWSLQTEMLVHPTRLPNYAELDKRGRSHADGLREGMAHLVHGHPMVTPERFAIRSLRAGEIRGDRVDEVVSLQTALESRLYGTWRSLLIDRGWSSEQLSSLFGVDGNYKALVTTILPRLLKGRWDVTAPGTVVGEYWKNLYMLRNRIVHGGYEPSIREAEAARQSYDDLRYFIRERAWDNRADYPRSALTVIGRNMMQKNGWEDAKFERNIEELIAEPNPWYWPWDLAGREPLRDRPTAEERRTARRLSGRR